MVVNWGGYFGSAEEANEWLDFDALDQDREDAAFSTPDQFSEWLEWRDGACR